MSPAAPARGRRLRRNLGSFQERVRDAAGPIHPLDLRASGATAYGGWLAPSHLGVGRNGGFPRSGSSVRNRGTLFEDGIMSDREKRRPWEWVRIRAMRATYGRAWRQTLLMGSTEHKLGLAATAVALSAILALLVGRTKERPGRSWRKRRCARRPRRTRACGAAAAGSDQPGNDAHGRARRHALRHRSTVRTTSDCPATLGAFARRQPTNSAGPAK